MRAASDSFSNHHHLSSLMSSRAPSVLPLEDVSPLFSTSVSSSDTSGEPLSVPTTNTKHVSGQQVLNSASRPTRSWQMSTGPGPRNTRKMHKSIILAKSTVKPFENHQVHENSPGGNVPANPSNAQSNASTEGPYACTSPAKRRRRAYSIRDEITTQEITNRSTTKAENPDAPKPAIGVDSVTRCNKQRNVQRPSRAGPSSSAPVEIIDLTMSDSDVETIHLPGENTHVQFTSSPSGSGASLARTVTLTPISEYLCPICYTPPTNATATPCGHVCCGECLFTAVRSELQRASNVANLRLRGPNVARYVFMQSVTYDTDSHFA